MVNAVSGNESVLVADVMVCFSMECFTDKMFKYSYRNGENCKARAVSELVSIHLQLSSVFFFFTTVSYQKKVQ